MVSYLIEDEKDVDADVAYEESPSGMHSRHFGLLELLLQDPSPSGVHLQKFLLFELLPQDLQAPCGICFLASISLLLLQSSQRFGGQSFVCRAKVVGVWRCGGSTSRPLICHCRRA